jgi:hypothetical protein
MGIHTFAELRSLAPEEFKNAPDDVLICDYSKDANLDPNQVASFFKLDDLIPLNCEKILYWHQVGSYQIPKSFLTAFIIATSLIVGGYLIWKYISRLAAGEGAVRTGIRWAAAGVFLVFGVSIGSFINEPLYKAFISFFILLIAIPAPLFIIGFLFRTVLRIARRGSLKNGLPFKSPFPSSRDSEEIWARIAEEMEGEAQSKALWAKAFAEANGSSENAKAIYMKLRYDQISSMQRE